MREVTPTAGPGWLGVELTAVDPPAPGARVSVVVKKNTALGMSQTAGAANVGDLAKLSVEELDQALRGAGIRAAPNRIGENAR